MKFKLICTAASNEAEALAIANELVKEKLIACANMFPVQSVYAWNQEIKHEKEFALFLKTKESLVAPVIEKIKSLHSYEIPEIISIPIEKGCEKYLGWINEETKQV